MNGNIIQHKTRDSTDFTSQSESSTHLQTLHDLNLPSEWLCVMKRYEIKSFIGSGSYGSVVLAVCNISGQEVAIKMIKDFAKHDYDCCKIIREVQVMLKLRDIS